MTNAAFLTVPATGIWFLLEFQLSLKFKSISGYPGLQSDPIPKGENTPSNPKFFNVLIFFHVVLDKLVFAGCRANGISLAGPQSENKMPSEDT